MYSLKVKNYRDDTLTLTGNPCYNLYRVDGLTPPSTTINSSANTTMDGDTINSVRVGSRNIVLYMTIEGEVEKNRINLYKYFPLKKTVTLYFTNDTRDVFISGMVETIECDLFASKQVAQISILCPQPYFKSVKSVVTEFSTVEKTLEFPLSASSDGTEFSAISLEPRKSVLNTGDVESGVIIELYCTGEVINPIIYDTLKYTHMAINFELMNEDRVIINTNAGEKSITLLRDGWDMNMIGYIVPNSTWFKLDVGDNLFTYECESGMENLQVTFTTNALYGGV